MYRLVLDACLAASLFGLPASQPKLCFTMTAHQAMQRRDCDRLGQALVDREMAAGLEVYDYDCVPD